MKPLSAFPLLALLAGCVGAPATPPRPAPVEVPAAFAADQSGEAASLAQWWRGWGDPALDHLVEQALAANPDLRAARAHVAASRALVSVAEGALYPTVAAQGAVWGGYSDASADGALGQVFSPYVSTGTMQARSVNLGASWEPDLFGGRHADVEAARALMQSVNLGLQGMRLTVAADVVENYQQAQGLRLRLALLDRSIATAQTLVAYAQARMEAGQANAGDITRAQTEMELSAQRPLLALIDARRRRLAVLAGLPPEQAVELAAPDRLVTPPAPGDNCPQACCCADPTFRPAQP
jgi:outer membrane protein TolC